MPLTSVIIPTHNRSSLLKKAIDSVLLQTESTIEILVVDDKSTDNTADLVTSYTDERVRYYSTRERSGNTGGAVARNIGIQHAKGDYVAFLDDDDSWLPEKLHKQITLLEEHPEASGSFTGFVIVDTQDKEIGVEIPQSNYGEHSKLLTRNWVSTASTIVLRKSIVDQINGFDENLPASQDWDLSLRASKIAPLIPVQEVLVRYLIHNSTDIKKPISVDASSVLRGRQLLFEKIQTELEDESKQLQAEYYFEEGRFYADKGLLQQARTSYWKSLVRTFSFTTFFRLITTMLPVSLYTQIIYLKRTLEGRRETIR